MTDDKRKRGWQDRSKVSFEETYEVSHVAKKFGVSVREVRVVINLIGNGRNKIYKELRRRLRVRGRMKSKRKKRRL